MIPFIKTYVNLPVAIVSFLRPCIANFRRNVRSWLLIVLLIVKRDSLACTPK